MWPGRPPAWARMRRAWRSISSRDDEQNDRVEIPLHGDIMTEPIASPDRARLASRGR